MGVVVEKGHQSISDGLANEVNRQIRQFKPKSYGLDSAKYEKLIKQKNLSVEAKKKKLLRSLHKTITHTLSIDPHKLDAKDLLDELKLNVRVIRLLIFKLRDINYYLDEVFLPEIGLKETKHDWGRILKKGTKRLKQKTWLDKKDLKKLEHTIYDSISRIITLDEKLLKKYQKKEAKVVRDEKVVIGDLEKIYGRESDLLTHLLAKFPPPNKVKKDLLEKEKFTHWASRILSLFSALEHNARKESKIIQKLKKSRKLKKKVESRIDYVLNEKLKLMSIKEQRALSWEHKGEIDETLHEAAHKYLAASQL